MAQFAGFDEPYMQFDTDDGAVEHGSDDFGHLPIPHTDDGSDPTGPDADLLYYYKGAYEADGHIFHVWEDNGTYGFAAIKSYTAPASSSGWPDDYNDLPELDFTIPTPSEAAAAAAAEPVADDPVVDEPVVADPNPILTTFDGPYVHYGSGGEVTETGSAGAAIDGKLYGHRDRSGRHRCRLLSLQGRLRGWRPHFPHLGIRHLPYPHVRDGVRK